MPSVSIAGDHRLHNLHGGARANVDVWFDARSDLDGSNAAGGESYWAMVSARSASSASIAVGNSKATRRPMLLNLRPRWRRDSKPSNLVCTKEPLAYGDAPLHSAKSGSMLSIAASSEHSRSTSSLPSPTMSRLRDLCTVNRRGMLPPSPSRPVTVIPPPRRPPPRRAPPPSGPPSSFPVSYAEMTFDYADPPSPPTAPASATSASARWRAPSHSDRSDYTSVLNEFPLEEDGDSNFDDGLEAEDTTVVIKESQAYTPDVEPAPPVRHPERSRSPIPVPETRPLALGSLGAQAGLDQSYAEMSWDYADPPEPVRQDAVAMQVTELDWIEQRARQARFDAPAFSAPGSPYPTPAYPAAPFGRMGGDAGPAAPRPTGIFKAASRTSNKSSATSKDNAARGGLGNLWVRLKKRPDKVGAAATPAEPGL